MANVNISNTSSESEPDTHIPHHHHIHSRSPDRRAPDIEQPRIRTAHYSDRTPLVYTVNATEFRHVQIATFANRNTLFGILQHYNANGRGRDVWRSRYKANRFLREEAARSRRHEVRIDTNPRVGPRSMFFRRDRGVRYDSDDDDDFDDPFGRPQGTGPRPTPGGGGGSRAPDHVYMTSASGRPATSRERDYAVGAEEIRLPERRYSPDWSRFEFSRDDRDYERIRPQQPHTVLTPRVEAIRDSRREQAPQNRRVRQTSLRGGGGKPVSESDVPAYFFMFDRGKPILIRDKQYVGLKWSNKTFITHLRQQYRALHDRWIMKPYNWVQDIGMIYVLVWVYDEPTRRIKLQNKAELVESPSSGSLSAHDFRYILENPPPGRCFGRTISMFLRHARKTGAGRNPQVVLMFEFANLPRARVLATLALFTIPISAAVGILYRALQSEIADAIALASYIATASSLFFAILGAGSLLGIEEPHAYTANDDLLEEYVKQRRIREGLFYFPGDAKGDNESPKGKDPA
ncbi:hypothetical protein DL768_010163 [Monosporascus sp. mg162]|nr:hypothetical protein DL768_010163 [Monosporascus sp. mg162]